MISFHVEVFQILRDLSSEQVTKRDPFDENKQSNIYEKSDQMRIMIINKTVFGSLHNWNQLEIDR